MLKLAKVKYEHDDYTKQELLYIEAELVKDIQYILKQVDAMRFQKICVILLKRAIGTVGSAPH